MVAAHHPHQRDAVNVVSLRDHLRAHQQIDLAGMQAGQHVLQIVAAAHRIAVHASNPRKRKDLAQPLLALLRARPQIVKVLAVALGAARRNRPAKAAVVALQPLPRTRNPRIFSRGSHGQVLVRGVVSRRLMVRQRNRAVLALQLFTAGSTND